MFVDHFVSRFLMTLTTTFRVRAEKQSKNASLYVARKAQRIKDKICLLLLGDWRLLEESMRIYKRYS